MRHQRTDLIVPIRDRRQGKRYLTLKNFGYAVLPGFVIFIGITIRSEMRATGPANYGRLIERELPKVEQAPPMEIVRETPTDDTEQTHADPMLIEPMAREQWLHDQAAVAPVEVPQRAAASMATGNTDVVIVGGPEGVKIVQRERRNPTLPGGSARQ